MTNNDFVSNQSEYYNSLMSHYMAVWNKTPNVYLFDKGPIQRLPFEFRVLEFMPNAKRNIWIYATCCMSRVDSASLIEIHLFSNVKDTSIIELLTAVAYYHNNSKRIGLNHVINFGRPWQDSSLCEFGFISLPYLDGPILEDCNIKILDKHCKCFWLIPITHKEFEFRIQHGAEALEAKFEENEFNYIDANRKSVV